MTNLNDTIVAVASPPGSAPRGIIRISGSDTPAILARYFQPVSEPWQRRRFLQMGALTIPGVHSPLPADLYFSPSPHSYTGQDTGELHLVSCPPLMEAVVSALLRAGARPAGPGEFTLRAFLSGKRDLTQAEAVVAVIEAGSEEQLRDALGQLAGGIARPLQVLRSDLLDLLADVEAGLDFVTEDIEFVGKPDILLRLSRGLARIMNVLKQLEGRSVSDRPMRVVLVGEPNAGKSSLFNALCGSQAAIVSPMAGTTRDYITRAIRIGETKVELIDTAGWQEAEGMIEGQAQQLGREQAAKADLLLWCIPADARVEVPEEYHGVPVVPIETKADLSKSGSLGKGWQRTSVVRGEGIAELKTFLAARAMELSRPPLAPSLSRCRHHIEAALGHLRKAHSVVLFDEPAELLALELRLGLDHLGETVGAVYTEDLLDRIFSRFCIGK